MISDRIPGGFHQAPRRGQLPVAWVRFTGSTATIVSSYNVASVNRAGAGDYEITFAERFSSATAAEWVGVATGQDQRYACITQGAPGLVRTRTDAGTLSDSDDVMVLYFASFA